MSDRTWISAHVFHSDGLDRLLTHGIRPLVDELAADGLVHAYFFLRYWDGGPHVRLRVRPVSAAVHDRVADVVATRCADYLRRHPSTTPVAVREYAAAAARLARWEGLATYRETPYPTDSVQFIPYAPEHDRYGTGAALHAVEEHFTDSSRIALALLGSGPTATVRQTAGFCAATLARLLCPVDSAPGSPPGSRFEERYAGQRDRLRGLAEAMRVLAAGRRPGGVPGALPAWRDSIAGLRDALQPHRHSVDAGAVVDACVHLFCNRIGVSLTEEGYLRYLAARTAADLAADAHGRE